MSTDEKQHNNIIKRLDSIESLLQGLVILEGERAGLTKADVRKIAGVGNAKITEIWKPLKSKQGK